MRAAIDPADLREIEARNRAAGSSFRLPLRLLPRAKREAMAVVYAVCRALDDAADADAPAAECRARFDRLALRLALTLVPAVAAWTVLLQVGASTPARPADPASSSRPSMRSSAVIGGIGSEAFLRLGLVSSITSMR